MRTTFRMAAAATTTLVAALALTACDGSDDAAAGDKPAAAASVPATGAPQTPAPGDASGSTAGSGKGTGSGSGGASGSGKGTGPGSAKHTGTGTGTGGKSGGKSADKPASGGGSADAPCTGANVKLTATPVTRPLNHVLLTVTNTGKTLCNAYYAPAVSFSDDQQSPIAVDKDTTPQAVVSLSPGASAYAMVRTLGEDDGSEPQKSAHITVYFTGKDDKGSTGPAAHASLAKPVAVVNSQARVTYWQSDLSSIDAW
ncbi:DUF4232 domain-containing protein [Streptomyces sp. NPDC006711]|uniref:DUF4232 domain-containing protein n=1 Tax=Streptomyces sp. NPDC006711 TaxID=3364762 RepID=UPI00369C2692